jgi:hypothetical protein
MEYFDKNNIPTWEVAYYTTPFILNLVKKNMFVVDVQT